MPDTHKHHLQLQSPCLHYVCVLRTCAVQVTCSKDMLLLTLCELETSLC